MPWSIVPASNPNTYGRGNAVSIEHEGLRVMLDDYDVMPHATVTLPSDARVREIMEHADDTISISFESDSGELVLFVPFSFHALMNALSLVHDFPPDMDLGPDEEEP